MAIQAVQLRKGMIIEMDGHLLRVHDFQHVTPGKGQAIVQTRLRNLRSGAMVDRRFRSQESVERVQLESKEMEYLYQEGDAYVFMDSETYARRSSLSASSGGRTLRATFRSSLVSSAR